MIIISKYMQRPLQICVFYLFVLLLYRRRRLRHHRVCSPSPITHTSDTTTPLTYKHEHDKTLSKFVKISETIGFGYASRTIK